MICYKVFMCFNGMGGFDRDVMGRCRKIEVRLQSVTIRGLDGFSGSGYSKVLHKG